MLHGAMWRSSYTHIFLVHVQCSVRTDVYAPQWHLSTEQFTQPPAASNSMDDIKQQQPLHHCVKKKTIHCKHDFKFTVV